MANKVAKATKRKPKKAVEIDEIEKRTVGGIGSQQLCWNCKRACNTADHKCPWADRGEPIEGWKATPTRWKDRGLEISSYDIVECPLFIKDKPFTDYAEVTKYVAEKLGFCVAYIQRNYEKMMARYEDQTGDKLPLWVWERQPYKTKKKISEQGKSIAARKIKQAAGRK